MCISDAAAAPKPWASYLSRQKLADSEILNARALGRDEQLSKILDIFESGDSICEASIDRLERNRARKFRSRRKKLLEVVAGWELIVDDGAIAFDSAVIREQLDWVRLNTSNLEWQSLWLHASGQTYAQIAAKISLKPSSIRALVARCRARLRELAISA
jgi:hypothetical protein